MSKSIRKMSVIVVVAVLAGLMLTASVGGQSQGPTKVAAVPCCQRHSPSVTPLKSPAEVAAQPCCESHQVAVVPPSEGKGKGPSTIGLS